MDIITINYVYNLNRTANGDIEFFKSGAEIPVKIVLTLTTATSYVLGGQTGTSLVTSVTTAAPQAGDMGTLGLSNVFVSKSDFNSHKHDSGSYTTFNSDSYHSHSVTVDPVTGVGGTSSEGVGRLDITGMSGTPTV